VRCIKAAQPLAARKFNRALVLNQLKYTGMLDTLQIRRKGFPSRWSHQAFWDDFHVLVPRVRSPHTGSGYDPLEMQKGIQDLVPKVLAKLHSEQPSDDQIKDSIRMGKSAASPGNDLVFLRDWLGNGLNGLRDDALTDASLTIQRVYRGSEMKKWWRRTVGARDIQTNLRTAFKCPRYTATRLAAKAVINEFRNIKAIAVKAPPEDIALFSAAYAEMQQFSVEIKEFEAAEAEERHLKGLEDDYAFAIADANITTKLENEKDDIFATAQHAYQQAQAALEQLHAKEAAPAPKKESSEGEIAGHKAGVVRSVPLVRRFKQGGSTKWTPPSRSELKFTYEFECKRPDA